MAHGPKAGALGALEDYSFAAVARLRAAHDETVAGDRQGAPEVAVRGECLLERPTLSASAEDIDRILVSAGCSDDDRIASDRHGLPKRRVWRYITGRLELGLLHPGPGRGGSHKHVRRPGARLGAFIERCADDHRVAGNGHRTAKASATTVRPVARVELCLLDPFIVFPFVDEHRAIGIAASEFGPHDERGFADRHRSAEVPRIDRIDHRQFRLLTPGDRAVDRDRLEQEVLQEQRVDGDAPHVELGGSIDCPNLKTGQAVHHDRLDTVQFERVAPNAHQAGIRLGGTWLIEAAGCRAVARELELVAPLASVLHAAVEDQGHPAVGDTGGKPDIGQVVAIAAIESHGVAAEICPRLHIERVGSGVAFYGKVESIAPSRQLDDIVAAAERHSDDIDSAADIDVDRVHRSGVGQGDPLRELELGEGERRLDGGRRSGVEELHRVGAILAVDHYRDAPDACRGGIDVDREPRERESAGRGLAQPNIVGTGAAVHHEARILALGSLLAVRGVDAEEIRPLAAAQHDVGNARIKDAAAAARPRDSRRVDGPSCAVEQRAHSRVSVVHGESLADQRALVVDEQRVFRISRCALDDDVAQQSVKRAAGFATGCRSDVDRVASSPCFQGQRLPELRGWHVECVVLGTEEDANRSGRVEAHRPGHPEARQGATGERADIVLVVARVVENDAVGASVAVDRKRASDEIDASNRLRVDAGDGGANDDAVVVRATMHGGGGGGARAVDREAIVASPQEDADVFR